MNITTTTTTLIISIDFPINLNSTAEYMRSENITENSISSQSSSSPTTTADTTTPAAANVEYDYIDGSMIALTVFFYGLYLLIFFLGISGNSLVSYVVIRNSSMHTVTNMFILNLAFSDILLCVFAVPFTPLYLLTFKEWVFGSVLCHLVPFAQGVSVYISAFTLMSIAIDRYFVIIYPFKARMPMKICLIIIIAVWFSAALLTLPYGIFMNVLVVEDILYCDEDWPFEESRKAFGISTSVLQFVIPFVIITYCYYRVCGKLSDRARARPGSVSMRREEIERERTKRTNRMLIAMVAIFVVSWLPLNCHNLVHDFYIPAAYWRYSRAFFVLVHAVAMSSTCYNPFLYAWLNENFRKEFKQVLPCFKTNLNAAVSAMEMRRRGGGGGAGRGGGGGDANRAILSSHDCNGSEFFLTTTNNATNIISISTITTTTTTEGNGEMVSNSLNASNSPLITGID